MLVTLSFNNNRISITNNRLLSFTNHLVLDGVDNVMFEYIAIGLLTHYHNRGYEENNETAKYYRKKIIKAINDYIDKAHLIGDVTDTLEKRNVSVIFNQTDYNYYYSIVQKQAQLKYQMLYPDTNAITYIITKPRKSKKD